MVTILVDIDGILTVETRGVPYAKRTPNYENINRVNRMFAAGCRVILFTSRLQIDEQRTRRWLCYYGVKYHRLILKKPRSTYIWDDKMIDGGKIDELFPPAEDDY